MKKTEIEILGSKVEIPTTAEMMKELKDNSAFHRFEQAMFEKLNQLYDFIVKGGLDENQTNYLRGQIEAIRFVLGLEADIQKQIEADAHGPIAYDNADRSEIDDFVERRYKQGEGSNE